MSLENYICAKNTCKLDYKNNTCRANLCSLLYHECFDYVFKVDRVTMDIKKRILADEEQREKGIKNG